MKIIMFAIFCFVSGASFGAYQYIISTDPELAVDPSVSAYTAVLPVNAQTAGNCALGGTFESRYRTSAESNTGALNRLKPASMLVIR